MTEARGKNWVPGPRALRAVLLEAELAWHARIRALLPVRQSVWWSRGRYNVRGIVLEVQGDRVRVRSSVGHEHEYWVSVDSFLWYDREEDSNDQGD